MLVADGGEVARRALDGAEPEVVVALWCAVLPRYAELQRPTPVAGLLAAAVPDLSPDRLLDAYDVLTGDQRWFTADVAPDHVGQHDRVLAARPQLARVAARLAGGVPTTIQHDDLHGGNVVLPAGKDAPESAQVIDWGDAVVALTDVGRVRAGQRRSRRALSACGNAKGLREARGPARPTSPLRAAALAPKGRADRRLSP